MTGHIQVFLCMPEELIYIILKFAAVILATILENMQLLLLFLTYMISKFLISYESTLNSFVFISESRAEIH